MWDDLFNPTIYISLGMEADGHHPYRHNMLSLGAVAYVVGRYTYSRRLGLRCVGLRRLNNFFSQNIRPQEGAMPDPEVMDKFWYKDDHHISLYRATQVNQLSIEVTMNRFNRWLDEVRRFVRYPSDVSFVPVARPGPFDFHWVWSAYEMSGVKNPFGNKGLDMQSYFLGARGVPDFRDASSSNWQENWENSDFPHTHIAVEDAAAQGEIFRGMFEDSINKAPNKRYALHKLRLARHHGELC